MVINGLSSITEKMKRCKFNDIVNYICNENDLLI